MKAFLHIGTPKTGTTTIQKFLVKNLQLLQKELITCPSMFGRNHQAIAFSFYESERHDDLTRDICRKHSLDEENQKSIETLKLTFKSMLKKEINKKHNSKSFNWIFSSEDFYGRLKSELEVKNLKNFLYEIFEEVDIIVFLRDPLLNAISATSQRVKHGQNYNPLLPHNFASHKSKLEKWVNIFGAKSIKARIFNKKYFKNNNIIHEFGDICEINEETIRKCQLPESQNESLSQISMVILDELYNNSTIKKLSRKKPAFHRSLVKIIQTNFKDCPPYRPTIKDLTNFRNYFYESDKWVSKQIFHIEEGIVWDQAFDLSYLSSQEERISLSEREKKLIASIKDLYLSNEKLNKNN